MSMIVISASDEATPLGTHPARLRGLVADVEALFKGLHLSPSRLADAPLLTDWRLSLCPLPCLVGTFGRQPSLGEGLVGWTADLTVHAPESGYARTLSRIYRLGAPSGEARR